VTYDPEKHHRRSVRLPGYDYSTPGAYFVTICTHDRGFLFGSIDSDWMVTNPAGMLARHEWGKTESLRENIEMDAFIVMPNHIHGIIVILEPDDPFVGARRAVPDYQQEQFGKPTKNTLPTIVRHTNQRLQGQSTVNEVHRLQRCGERFLRTHCPQ